jgi:hypothetical protein
VYLTERNLKSCPSGCLFFQCAEAEQLVFNRIFIDDGPGEYLPQPVRKSCFPYTGQPCHQNQRWFLYRLLAQLEPLFSSITATAMVRVCIALFIEDSSFIIKAPHVLLTRAGKKPGRS